MADDEDSKTIRAEPAEATATPKKAFGIAGVSSTIRDRRDSIKQQIPDSGEIPDNDVKDDIRLFFLWGHAVIEEYSAHLIRLYLIEEGFEEATWGYISGGSRPSISQSHREELLMQSGVFAGIEGKIGNVRGIRNQVAHDPHAPLRWEEDEIEARMDTMVEVIEDLYAALTEDEVKQKVRSGTGL